MLNHIVLMGRLTRDPELRRTSSGIAVASFSIAVDRDFGRAENGEKETDFIDIVAWRNTAEFVSKYFSKGRMAVVSGRLQIRNWQDKEGNKRRTAEVVADNIYFGDSRQGGQNGQAGGYNQQNAGFDQTPSYGSFGQNQGYAQSYGGGQSYAPPQGGSAYSPAPPANTESEFSVLEDDDSELPF